MTAMRRAGPRPLDRDQEPPEGYAIRTKWIGPLEGNEYSVALMGLPEVIAYRKSWRAACRAAWKHSEGKLK